MTINPLILYDRSRVTTDWRCPRQRYWQYEYAGKGVVSGKMSLPLWMGTVVHDGLAAIAELTHAGATVDIDLIATAAQQQMYTSLFEAAGGAYDARTYALEQAALVEGMVRGFYKYAWPRLLAQFPEILFTETEMSYNHGPEGSSLRMMAKPDLILRNPLTGEVAYIEYKTTSSKRAEWVNQWDTAVQLHSTIRAVAQTTGIDVTSVVIQGLYKGYESYGKQSSPFCYAYRRSGNPPFSKSETSYEYAPGMKRTAVWEMEGGVKSWVENMPDAILVNQFPQTPPIYVNDTLLDAFFSQREVRETEIASASHLLATNPDITEDTALLHRVFPQKFSECVPGFGSPCDYRILCHGGVTDPLRAGFTWRTPHHQPETDAQLSREVTATGVEDGTDPSTDQLSTRADGDISYEENDVSVGSGLGEAAEDRLRPETT